jgi:hypothetical protein
LGHDQAVELPAVWKKIRGKGDRSPRMRTEDVNGFIWIEAEGAGQERRGHVEDEDADQKSQHVA